MNLWSSLKGLVVAELTSADVTGSLEAVTELGIPVRNVISVDELTLHLTLDRRDYERVAALAEKRGEKISCLHRRGLHWSLAALKRRPVLLSGILFLLILELVLPTRVLFVRVEGNETIPARQILAEAENCEIRFWASRRDVRSEKVKNALLSAIPRLQWAGVNTTGCVATISVREASETETEAASKDVSSIVADRDGVILSCTVTSGSGQCSPGQAVQEGQVLISGYTDCGLLLKATRAEGEIQAQTQRSLSVVSLCQRRIRGQVQEQSRQYSLILGKKRINFANSSRICDTSCGRMYEEYYITLPGGFTLPVALAVQTHLCCETFPENSEQENRENMMKEFARSYLAEQMISGSIQRETCLYEAGDGICRLDADYLCRELIGRRVQEGKVEINGKSD